MLLRVSFQNLGGELDHRIVDTEQKASFAAGEMIEDAGELHAGDKIIITDVDDDFSEDRHLA